MAEDGEIDIEGDFDFKLDVDNGMYDSNELPSKSANLLPEYTNPAWMLEQGWTMDSFIDEKSKATIEKMLHEEQYYINGKGSPRRMKSTNILSKKPQMQKQPWTEEEKIIFEKSLEIFGRSWSKIAEQLPSRTGLQVKNYAQQYFKQKERKTINQNSGTMPTSSSVSTTEHNQPIDQVIAMVTTAQTTIATVPMSEKNPVFKRVSSLKFNQNNSQDSKMENKNKFESELAKTLLKNVNKVKGVKNKSLVKQSSANKKKKNKEKSVQNKSTGTQLSITIQDRSMASQGMVNSTQLSPSLESKLQQSTGIIENLEGFSAVADIVEEDGEEEIDIENDDEENPILKSRSASPNSVYEQLVKAANIMEPTIEEDPVDPAPQKKEEVPAIDQPSTDIHVNDNLSFVEEKKEEEECVKKPKSNNCILLSTGEYIDLPIPTDEAKINLNVISEEERIIHQDFFDGRPSKTPERYVKIRNYIVESWKKCKPTYLNKTCVRPGLKNCGDVNCIGRIHAYLECTGVINFGCEQACYNQVTKPGSQMSKEKNSRENIIKFTKLDTVRPRKRRIRNEYGQWVDEKELQGKTIPHIDKSLLGESQAKVPRPSKVSYDPFKLIPCEVFTNDRPAPFYVELHNTAIVVMDVHAHISKTEVIGMLGGCYHSDEQQLEITMAIPCNSISTGMQCEMDPVSQTFASEEISNNGMRVIGWYHSHPTFNPNPSVRDIETQLKFQDWFAQDGWPFVGIIVSPYNRITTDLCSQFQCLTISSQRTQENLCNIPYCFNYGMVMQPVQSDFVMGCIKMLAEKYCKDKNRVELLLNYRASITCLNKMIESIKDSLEPYCAESSQFVAEVQEIFTTTFSCDKDNDKHSENMSPNPAINAD